jgi:hypothetical protein
VSDVSGLLQNRRFDLGLDLLHGLDLHGDLMRLFTVRTDLRLRAVAFTQDKSVMDDPVLAEPFCVEIERALQASEAPPSH